MSVAVRSLDLITDHQDLLKILGRNLPFIVHSRRFQWLYRDNPAGQAWSWCVYEQGSRKIVGVASVFPRFIWVGQKEYTCGQVGDFAINTSHRSLGPAVLLQRATFEPVSRGELIFCYDCPPNEKGLAPFRRLGMRTNCRMHRYAMLIRSDRRVKKRFGSGTVGAGVAAIGNWALRVRSSRKNFTSGLELGVHDDRFGEEFTILDDRCQTNCIRSRRTANDLNWRYRDNPLEQYYVLTARRKGELMGCIIYSVEGLDAKLIDLWGVSLDCVGPPLLDATIGLVRQTRAETLHALVADRAYEVKLIRQFGFRWREDSAHVVAYATNTDCTMKSAVEQAESWAFNYANIAA